MSSHQLFKDGFPIPHDIIGNDLAEPELLLPTAYMEFCHQYGCVRLNDFLTPLNYLNTIEGCETYQRILSNYADMHRDFPEFNPFEPFPALNGLLPLAVTDNGDEIYWYCQSKNPDEWTVLVWQSRSDKYWLYPWDALTFFERVCTGKTTCPAFFDLAANQVISGRLPIR